MRALPSFASIAVLLIVQSAYADPGDSCTKNKDCSNGEHCRANICKAVAKAKPVDSAGASTSGDTEADSDEAGANSSRPRPQHQNACGLPDGYTLTCKLVTGQVYNACGMAGAIPARVGEPCHIGYVQGVGVEQQ